MHIFNSFRSARNESSKNTQKLSIESIICKKYPPQACNQLYLLWFVMRCSLARAISIQRHLSSGARELRFNLVFHDTHYFFNCVMCVIYQFGISYIYAYVCMKCNIINQVLKESFQFLIRKWKCENRKVKFLRFRSRQYRQV